MTEAEALKSVDNLIKFYALKWRHFIVAGRLEWEDLLQAGRVGAIEAYRRFDPAICDTYATYAAWWIRARLGDLCMNHGRVVRHPIRVLREAKKAGERVPMNAASLDNEEWHLEAPERYVVDRDIEEQVRLALGSLTHRERKALKLRFSDEEPNLTKVGKAIGGVTRERARQIVARALTKLRDTHPELKELL